MYCLFTQIALFSSIWFKHSPSLSLSCRLAERAILESLRKEQIVQGCVTFHCDYQTSTHEAIFLTIVPLENHFSTGMLMI